MNLSKTLVLLLLLAFGVTSAQDINSQLTRKQQEQAKVAQDIFSPDEKDQLFFFYQKRMDEMGLQGDARDEYYHILYYHTTKMKRFNDKDAHLTESAKKAKFDKQLAMLDVDASEMLTEEQYALHLKTWDQLTGTIYAKKGWN
jgi:hypothetical protein